MTIYKIKKREIKEISDLGGIFYKDIIEKKGGFKNFLIKKGAYIGYEHSPQDLTTKLPNITHIWNLELENGFLYGSTLGHEHPPSDFSVQEIYEFQNFGAMFIHDKSLNKNLLYVCKENDKIAVPQNCIMTILNLSEKDLLTLDMANPEQNPSSKEVLKKNKGPMIAIYNDSNSNVEFKLNHRYKSFDIKEDLTLDFKISGDKDLYEKILEESSRLRNYNIEVIEASQFIECEGRNGIKYSLNENFDKLINSKDKTLHKLLGML